LSFRDCIGLFISSTPSHLASFSLSLSLSARFPPSARVEKRPLLLLLSNYGFTAGIFSGTIFREFPTGDKLLSARGLRYWRAKFVSALAAFGNGIFTVYPALR